jgi:hypothetical protein
MKLTVLKGATSQTVYLFIRDSSSTTGDGLTGLAYNSGGLVASYVRPLGSRTAITLATQTVTGAWSSGGFVEVDATSMPGVYRLDVPDAVFASGVNSAIVMLKGATNMEPSVIEFALEAVNAQDAVRMGLTALPNANAEAAGGLYTRGTGAGQINQPANGMADVNVVRNAGTAITASAGRQEVNVSHYGGTAGTFSGGRPEVNTTHAAGTAWNSGAIGANTLATDTITAAKIAADAIGASELAADAVTEIQSGLATAANLATVAGYLDTEIAAILADTNELQTDWANGGRLDLILDARASQSSVDTMQGNVTDILADTADMQPKLGTPAGASISADIAAIEAQTDDIGAAGAGLTAVPWNPAWGAEVQSEVQDAIEANHLDHLLAVTYDPASKPGAADALLNELVESDSGVARFTANALEEAPSGTGASAASIAAAMFTVDTGETEGDAVPGSVVYEIVQNAGGGGGLDAAGVRAAIGMASADLDTQLDAIKSDTAATLTDTAEIGAAGAGLTALASATNLATLAGYVDTEVAAIKAKTDNLPSDPADASDIASSFSTVNSTLSTIAGYIDTEIAAIKAKTDLIPASPAAAGDIPSAASNAAAVLASVVEGAVTLVQSLRLMNAALGGKASGLDTTNPKYRDLGDTTDRIDATVDADGNRSAVTLDLS